MSTGVTAPLGFQAAGVAAGIKPDRLDLALLACDTAASVAGVFTTNRAQAAPVLLTREHAAAGTARAIVINAGCANAATGAPGLVDAREMAAITAAALDCEPQQVLVASTGVIGVRLPMEKVRPGIRMAVTLLSPGGGPMAARAIMTTDTYAKEATLDLSIGGRPVRIGAMAKGAGMIAPNMATMLAFFTTDAAVAPRVLRQALVEAVGATLNRITVDGDTSTNDMAVVMASGASGAPRIAGPGADYDVFAASLAEAARQLAMMIVRDGEGASRIAEVRVTGAASDADADRVARTVAESPLVKTALCGGDPNWGRILAAAGRAGVAFDVTRVGIHLGDVHVAASGAALEYDEDAAHAAVTEDPVRLRVDLGSGTGSGVIWTCDFGHGYVDVNAHYRS